MSNFKIGVVFRIVDQRAYHEESDGVVPEIPSIDGKITYFLSKEKLFDCLINFKRSLSRVMDARVECEVMYDFSEDVRYILFILLDDPEEDTPVEPDTSEDRPTPEEGEDSKDETTEESQE